MSATTDFTTVEKSIRYCREDRDYSCYLIYGGEEHYIGSRGTYSESENLCNAEYYRLLEDMQAEAAANQEAPAAIPADVVTVTQEDGYTDYRAGNTSIAIEDGCVACMLLGTTITEFSATHTVADLRALSFLLEHPDVRSILGRPPAPSAQTSPSIQAAYDAVPEIDRPFTNVITEWMNRVPESHKAMAAAGCVLLEAAANETPLDDLGEEDDAAAAYVFKSAYDMGYAQGGDDVLDLLKGQIKARKGVDVGTPTDSPTYQIGRMVSGLALAVEGMVQTDGVQVIRMLTAINDLPKAEKAAALVQLADWFFSTKPAEGEDAAAYQQGFADGKLAGAKDILSYLKTELADVLEDEDEDGGDGGTPAIEIVPYISDDHIDPERFNEELGLDFHSGPVEVYVSHEKPYSDVIVFGGGGYEIEQVRAELPHLLALLSSPTVQHAQARSWAGLPARSVNQIIRRAA